MRCPLCPFSGTITSMVHHYKLHKNVANFNFPCPADRCIQTFRKFASFKSHVYRDHAHSKQFRCSSTTSGGSRAVENSLIPASYQESTILSCAIPSCNFQSRSLSDFVSHLKYHLADGVTIECPFLGCTQTYKVKSSFTSHISRQHREYSIRNVKSDFCLSPETSSLQSSPQEVGLGSVGSCMADCEPNDHHHDDSESESIVEEEPFKRAVAMFYLKLQAKLLLPVSTVQDIISELTEIYDLSLSRNLSILKDKLSLLGVSDEISLSVIEELKKCDLWNVTHKGPLRSDCTRKTFYKKEFEYIASCPFYLGDDDSGSPCYMEYVPVRETLPHLVELSSQYMNAEGVSSPLGCTSNVVFSDLHDGKVVKSNVLFQSEPASLKIMLYQDAFEVVNPLGSGKKKHKIEAMYFTLANLPAHLRSSTDHMQLVFLCPEKHLKQFGREKVFQRLIRDLKVIETEGITLKNGTVLKGTVVAVLGDNLGSHGLGGFVENFAHSEYFCRYCRVQRVSYLADPLSVGTYRTPQTFNETCAQVASEETVSLFGIKNDTLFNALSFYHVAQPGLPPCIAHDLFEGVVSKDLWLYIHHFAKKGRLFSFDHLNRVVNKFKYLGSDVNNKPCIVDEKKKKLSGSATQNWCFLRLLPIFIGNKMTELNEEDSSVWELVLTLRSIVELVCAPKISGNQIGVLKQLIEDYITLRGTAFPEVPLLPKHHYLVHYPMLITQFGPLIRVWTLRFESKHGYFKQCVAKLKNFINVCAMLAHRHQLLQAYLSVGSLYPPSINLPGGNPFYLDTVSDSIRKAVSRYEFNHENSVYGFKASYKGSDYSRGGVVVLEHDGNDLVFGEIQKLIVHSDRLYVLVKVYHSEFVHELGMHALLVPDGDIPLICVNVEELLDYYPLVIYSSGDLQLIPLHHSVCYM